MTDFPNILNTDIINSESDIFWTNQSELTANKTVGQVLVIASKYAENSAEQTQLEKILSACQLTTGTFNIIQLEANTKMAWHQLRDTLQPPTVLLFGIHPNNLGISALFRLNSTNNFDGVTVVPTLSLHDLEQQPQAKKDLWVNALKPLFADKQ